MSELAIDPKISSNLYKEGYLTKQGEIIQSWKRRFFILRAKKLYYFKNEKKAKSGAKPIGIIDLNLYKTKKITKTDYCDKQNAFILLSKNSLDRPYLIYADSPEEQEQWISTLQTITDNIPLTSSQSEIQTLQENLLSEFFSKRSDSVSLQQETSTPTKTQEEIKPSIKIQEKIEQNSQVITSTLSSSDELKKVRPKSYRDTPFWKKFFWQCEIDESLIDSFVQLFEKNELTEADLPDFDHDLLKSMGITVAKTRLKILKTKNLILEKKEKEEAPTLFDAETE